MHLLAILYKKIVRSMIVLVPAILLASCGAVTITGQLDETPSAQSSAATTSSSGLLAALNAPVSARFQGFHVELNSVNCGLNISLKDTQNTYDAGSLKQVADFLLPFAKGSAFGLMPEDLFSATDVPPLPTMLEAIPGAHSCDTGIDITNTGTDPVQITGFGIRLTSRPVPNASRYHLVDVCTMWPNPVTFGPCYPEFSGHCVPEVVFNLSGSDTSDKIVVPAKSNYDERCFGLTTVAPGDDAGFGLKFTSKPDNWKYTIELTVDVSTSHGDQTLVIPSPKPIVLTLASADRFSCYGLQGDSFVQEAFNQAPSEEQQCL